MDGLKVASKNGNIVVSRGNQSQIVMTQEEAKLVIIDLMETMIDNGKKEAETLRQKQMDYLREDLRRLEERK